MFGYTSYNLLHVFLVICGVIQIIPIPPIDVMCRHGCCMRRLIPLKLAYAKSIHTFQGQSAGPTEPGRPANTVQRIICDAGSINFERLCPGLMYSLISRATTLGTNRTALDSAIYFTGDFTEKRVMNMGRKKDGTLTKRVALRKLWVDRLEHHIRKCTMSQDEQQTLIHWVTTTKYTPQYLLSLVDNNRWRTVGTVNY